MNAPIEYTLLKRRLARGWNTWNTRSVLSHVLLPHGLAINLGLKEYGSARYLKESFIGQQGQDQERIIPGRRASDGSFTELILTWQGIEVLVQSATVGVAPNDDLVLLVTPRQLPYAPPALVAEAGLLWNRPGLLYHENEHIVFQDQPLGPATIIPIYAAGPAASDPHIPAQAPYLVLRLDQPVGISTGRPRTIEQITDIITSRQAEHESRSANELYSAIQTCLAWDTIYDPAAERVISPVSRIWSIGHGGWVLFDWDTYFAAWLAAPDDKDLAYANAVEITREKTESGFIPNFSYATGGKSRDRSQPPVGALTVLELYRRFGDLWLVEMLFDDLLAWNRWWDTARSFKGLLCWGSTPYTPVIGNPWETDGVNARFGAALESGLDNSPMYDDIPFDKDRHILKLWDTGLNGLYLADCEAVAELARLLGREAEAVEVERRRAAYSANLPILWNAEAGIFMNRRWDTGEFSPRLSPTNFYPLLGGAATLEQAARMIDEHFYNPQEFWGEWIMPSIARNDPAYPEQTYWRGRIWAPMNFLVYLGLRRYDIPPAQRARRDLAEKSKALLLKEWQANGHVHENYNANTGAGCDIHSSDRYYHWGALLGLIALMEADGK
jgi:hypothetical protein